MTIKVFETENFKKDRFQINVILYLPLYLFIVYNFVAVDIKCTNVKAYFSE